MTTGAPGSRAEIATSWHRCERQHRLAREAARPTLRLLKGSGPKTLEARQAQTGGGS